VPETKTQLPSDQELRSYLDEWLKTSAVSLLADYPEDRKNYHPEVVEALSYLSSSGSRSKFLTTVNNSIFQSLQRLNQLPRSDPFWYNTNCRPTIFQTNGVL
jgi:hypothetical protein